MNKITHIHLEEYGSFDSIEVHLTDDKLTFRSYWEGKAEGYNFSMERHGDDFALIEDETSYPVPGSHVLWLYANGFTSWTAEAERLSPKGTGIGDVRIPDTQISAAVEQLISSERETLDLQ